MVSHKFVDEETVPLVQDEDYDAYKTLDTSRVDDLIHRT